MPYACPEKRRAYAVRATRRYRARHPDRERAQTPRKIKWAKDWRRTHQGTPALAQYDRWRNIKRKYGITRADFEALAWLQGHRCLCCNTVDRLVIDHCHTTNSVRGLICFHCNVMIGFAREDAANLAAGVRYLGAVL